MYHRPYDGTYLPSTLSLVRKSWKQNRALPMICFQQPGTIDRSRMNAQACVTTRPRKLGQAWRRREASYVGDDLVRAQGMFPGLSPALARVYKLVLRTAASFQPSFLRMRGGASALLQLSNPCSLKGVLPDGAFFFHRKL